MANDNLPLNANNTSLQSPVASYLIQPYLHYFKSSKWQQKTSAVVPGYWLNIIINYGFTRLTITSAATSYVAANLHWPKEQGHTGQIWDWDNYNMQLNDNESWQ